MRIRLAAVMGGLLLSVSCGHGASPVSPDTAPPEAVPPQIRSVAVVPPTVTLGGTAQVTVDAIDPGGATVVCRFAAEAGQVLVPDPKAEPCRGVYTNDGKPRTSDTITVVATNPGQLSATAKVSVALGSPVEPAPNPAPSPPCPAPLPTPTTPPALQPPVVTTQPATNVTASSATLNATVDGRGAPANFHFDYGTSAGYGSSTSEENVPSGASAVAVSQGVSGLTCGTAYRYRVVGTNVAGQTPGAERSFTTAACPPTVAVSSSGDCHPVCAVTFTATTTNAIAVSWSGCASGNGSQATCAVTSLEVITATVAAVGPGGTAQASASAKGINAAPVVTCLGNYFFPAESDQALLYAVDDPDDPASTGTGSATYDRGTAYGAGFRPGGPQNIWEVGIHVGAGRGTVIFTYWDRWGAQGRASCPVTGT